MEHKYKQYSIAFVIITILLISGCIENVQKHVTDVSSEVVDFTIELTNTFQDFIKDINDIKPDYYINEKNISLAISRLDPIDENSITSYFDIGDLFDDLFTILNDEGGYDIPIPKNAEEYKTISKYVTEWSPIIKEYNNVIFSAKEYNENDEESVREFRKCIALLGLEFAVIYLMVWYKPAFWTVGKVYRWSGFNKLAFTHPKLVKVVLSKAHWGVRTALVDKTTESVDSLFGWLDKVQSKI